LTSGVIVTLTIFGKDGVFLENQLFVTNKQHLKSKLPNIFKIITLILDHEERDREAEGEVPAEAVLRRTHGRTGNVRGRIGVRWMSSVLEPLYLEPILGSRVQRPRCKNLPRHE
jgi:hypothetical protein